MNLDEALATLTHICAQRPGLKLNPSQCEKRKAVGATHMNPMALFQPGIECRDCPGPIPIFFDPNPHQEREAMKPGERKEAKCGKCGETDPRKFYPSNKSRCKKCLAESQKKTRQSETIPAPVPIVESLDESVIMHTEEQPAVLTGNGSEKPEKFKYHCDIHGPHNGHKIGSHHSAKCKECIQEERARGIAEANSQKIFLSLAGRGFIKPWLEQEAAALGIDPKEMLIRVVLERIPADFIKRYFLSK